MDKNVLNFMSETNDKPLIRQCYIENTNQEKFDGDQEMYGRKTLILQKFKR